VLLLPPQSAVLLRMFQKAPVGKWGRAAPGPSTVPTPGPSVLLAHVRRWTKDRRFFKLLRKHFQVDELESASGCQKGGQSLPALHKRLLHGEPRLGHTQTAYANRRGLVP